MCSSPWNQISTKHVFITLQVIQYVPIMGTKTSLAIIGAILTISSSHLISLLVVVPLQVVKDGRPHQQVGEGDDDKGEGANLSH